MELWLLFGTMSCFSYAVSTCIDKYMMNLKYDVISTNVFKALFNGIIVLVIGFAFFNLNFLGSFSFLMLIPGAIWAFSTLVYYTAIKLKDVGEIMPFYQSLDILFIFIFSAIVFNEFVSTNNCFGIILVLIGVYLVLSRDGLKIPRIDRASLIILVLVPTDIINVLLVKKLLFNIEPIYLAIVMYFSATLFLISFQIIYRKHIFEITTNLKPRLPKIAGASFFGALGTFFLLFCFVLGICIKGVSYSRNNFGFYIHNSINFSKRKVLLV